MSFRESSATVVYGKDSSAPMPRREHRRPNRRCRQWRANSSGFPMASSSKPSFARRRRRHRASYSWSSTPSSCNRFGNIFWWPSSRTRYRCALQVVWMHSDLRFVQDRMRFETGYNKWIRTSFPGQIWRRKLRPNV